MSRDMTVCVCGSREAVKVRELLVAQRTQMLNALRSHLAEIGIIAARGLRNARALAVLIVEGNDMMPAIVRAALLPVVHRFNELDQVIRQSDQAIRALVKADATTRRLMIVPGIGPVTASTLTASVQMLGGNQSNKVSIAEVSKARLLGYGRPAAVQFGGVLPLTTISAIVTTNEA